MADGKSRAAVKDPSGSGVNYSVQNVTRFDYSGTDDFLTTKVYHGVSIVAGGGDKVVGRIQSWQPDSYTRDGIHLYELAAISWGRPVEYVPGKATGFTIAVTRAEVWSAEMERAFFNSAKPATTTTGLYNDLIDQTKPFKVQEFWIRGDADYLVWTYNGCWFTNKNQDAITSDGDGVTRINATIAYVSKTHAGNAAAA